MRRVPHGHRGGSLTETEAGPSWPLRPLPHGPRSPHSPSSWCPGRGPRRTPKRKQACRKGTGRQRNRKGMALGGSDSLSASRPPGQAQRGRLWQGELCPKSVKYLKLCQSSPSEPEIPPRSWQTNPSKPDKPLKSCQTPQNLTNPSKPDKLLKSCQTPQNLTNFKA